MGALKRKYKLGRGDVEPGTFINKVNQPKEQTQKIPQNPTKRTAFMGLI